VGGFVMHAVVVMGAGIAVTVVLFIALAVLAGLPISPP
jgi:hypothetical protein